uniref:2S sulfur-rich seed storage protein 2-like n=2 Tax=Nicotiana TaxID=4085 RepID=A0A1S4CZN0_TOBAC|nr:PREDICTED: 2S sulfur-rich seed storage protein 2-like [Nicotiana sylvestris]XP_016506581.1 PREDICTED: 2S sulfur-rich seed storage protein 2-like [Nicotiana tabacum]
MGKLSLVASLLLCLLVVASANTATSTEDEHENQGSQRCQEQIQRQRLNHCRIIMTMLENKRYMYLSRSRQYYGDELSMVRDDDESNQGQQHLQQCCQELRNMDTQCRCEALRRRRRMMQERGSRGQESERIMERARYLPRTCNIQPTQCRF